MNMGGKLGGGAVGVAENHEFHLHAFCAEGQLVAQPAHAVERCRLAGRAWGAGT